MVLQTLDQTNKKLHQGHQIVQTLEQLKVFELVVQTQKHFPLELTRPQTLVWKQKLLQMQAEKRRRSWHLEWTALELTFQMLYWWAEQQAGSSQRNIAGLADYRRN
jgi:hypothetical protein